MSVKWSRLFWILVLSAAVLLAGAAWLSAHRLSAASMSPAKQAHAVADLGAARSGSGDRQVGAKPTPTPTQPSDTPAVVAGDQAVSGPSPSGTEGQPSSAPQAAGAPRAGETPAIEADVAVAPPRGAPRVNPTSGELMWSARDVIPDGGRPDEPLCGGKACQPGQFCCGPPACGRCAYPMAGPRCPSVCPEQTRK